MQQTLAIIKPDAVAAKASGKIIDMIEQHGFAIKRLEKRDIDSATAERFYAVHKGKPFFEELITFMTSGPAVVMVLEKENAIQAWRDLMGSTDPQKAPAGSIRQLFGTDIGKNATHGSDAPETAAYEINVMFG